MPGVAGMCLTWLGDSQELGDRGARHLAVTKGTHHQHGVEGPCVRVEAWCGARSTMWPQTTLQAVTMVGLPLMSAGPRSRTGDRCYSLVLG